MTCIHGGSSDVTKIHMIAWTLPEKVKLFKT
uniref:Uncharacterized protein n=1 Tax=Rhizophora mucronata TaxID=61149 RepID=A0A2P2N1G9_RHIMU